MIPCCLVHVEDVFLSQGEIQYVSFYVGWQCSWFLTFFLLVPNQTTHLLPRFVSFLWMHSTENPELLKIFQPKESLTHSNKKLNDRYHTAKQWCNTCSNKRTDGSTVQLHWVVVSNIFYVHTYLGKIPILANIFQRGTPLKINMEHNHGGLVQIFFLSKKIGDL